MLRQMHEGAWPGRPVRGRAIHIPLSELYRDIISEMCQLRKNGAKQGVHGDFIWFLWLLARRLGEVGQ